MGKTSTFRNFGDFWHFTRPLKQQQIDIIYHSLPLVQQRDIQKSYRSGGWEDLFKRNEVDKIVDEIKNDSDLQLDLLDIRIKVMSQKSVYVDKKKWEYAVHLLSGFQEDHINYVLGGIEEEIVDDTTILLVPVKKNG